MKTIEELGISPAPWKNHGVERDPFGFVRIRDKDGFFIADVDGESDGNANANGDIIAAAPKMYEALYLILRCWGHGILAEGGFACEYECTDDEARCTWEDCPILKKARAAIAEASGEVANG